MVKKLKIKFVCVATASIAALLIAILAVVNVVNFSLVADDADKVLDMIRESGGQFSLPFNEQPTEPAPFERGENFANGGHGPMGPNSADNKASMRFFTVAFSADGTGRIVKHNLSVVSEQEAVEWATRLKNAKGGWTHSTYRYETYAAGGETFVTVVDQARELLPSYRVLYASIIGTISGLAIAVLVLALLSDKFVKPLTDSERKQKKFVAEAARELKTPLTVIAVDKEYLKDEFGENDATRSIDKQTDKLMNLTLKLNELLVIEREEIERAPVNMSELTKNSLDGFNETFSANGVIVTREISENVFFDGDEILLKKAIYELIDNAARFAEKSVEVSLSKSEKRVKLAVSSDVTGEEDGDRDTAFDRFYKSPDSSGNGLGLSIVKEIVSVHGGRARAYVRDGKFVVKIEL